jgi:hypothetical protein
MRDIKPTINLHVNTSFQAEKNKEARIYSDTDAPNNHALSAERVVEALHNSGMTVEQFLDSLLRDNIKNPCIAIEMVEDLLKAQYKMKVEHYLALIVEKISQADGNY